MVEEKHKKWAFFTINNRRLSILILSFFAAWLFTIPFEGKVLYMLLDNHQLSTQPFVLGSMAAHCAGLILCGFFIKNLRSAKMLMIISLAFCIVATTAFFFAPSFWWQVALFSSSFLAGCCVATWGYFLKSGTPKNERYKTIADMLAFSYILLLLIVKAAWNISAHIGLILTILPLCIALLLTFRFSKKEIKQCLPSVKSTEQYVSIVKPLGFLCLFILIVAINVGLMYQMQFPAFAHLEQLNSWYWAIPYIAGVMIVRYLPRKVKRTNILYAAIAMTGFSFIGFMLLDRSTLSYLIVHTLMFSAVGIFNLFWWTMLSEMLEFHKNPARILGAGLFANVLGILIGELIISSISLGNAHNYLSLLALSLVFFTLIMLPLLYSPLTALLKNHEYLTTFSEMPQHEQTRLIHKYASVEKLTIREAEIALLLIKGKTYRMIASELHISENTVRFHVKNIYSKYVVRNRVELINAIMSEKTNSGIH